MLRLSPIPTLPLSLLLACDPGRDGGPSVCDPFVADEQPSKLRDLLAVGRAVGEELYVVDHASYGDRIGDPRVFVSDGAALRRVRYEGYVGTFEMQWTFPVAQHEPPFTLMVSDDAGVLRMGLLTGTAQADPFAIGVVGAELTVVDDAAVDGRAVYNFVSTVEFEYAARTADGRTVVVLGPEQSEDYDHYRLVPWHRRTRRARGPVLRPRAGRRHHDDRLHRRRRGGDGVVPDAVLARALPDAHDRRRRGRSGRGRSGCARGRGLSLSLSRAATRQAAIPDTN